MRRAIDGWPSLTACRQLYRDWLRGAELSVLENGWVERKNQALGAFFLRDNVDTLIIEKLSPQ